MTRSTEPVGKPIPGECGISEVRFSTIKGLRSATDQDPFGERLETAEVGH